MENSFGKVKMLLQVTTQIFFLMAILFAWLSDHNINKNGQLYCTGCMHQLPK